MSRIRDRSPSQVRDGPILRDRGKTSSVFRRIVSACGSAMLLGLALAFGPAQRLWAASNAYLNIQVQFSGALSVSVDGETYSTRTFSAGSNALVVPSSATVENTSSGLSEIWDLTVSTVSGGGNWAVQGSTLTPPDVDQYAFQSLFISSATTALNQPAGWVNGCPGPNDADWNAYASTVTGVSSMYDSFLYSDPSSIGSATGNPDIFTGSSNGDMEAAPGATNGQGIRGLCSRIYMPVGTVFVGQPQVIRLTITAAAGL